MVTITLGTVFTKLKNLTPYERKQADFVTRFYVTGAEFSKPFKERLWDGWIHLLTYRNAVPTGMVSVITKRFKRKEIDYTLIDDRKLFPIDNAATAPFGENIFSKKMLCAKKLRPYQQKAVAALLTKRVGVVVLPTGSGKTVIICAAIALMSKAKRIVVLASGISLLHQLRHRIADALSVDVGYIGEGQWSPARVTVASVDTLSGMVVPPPKVRKKKSGDAPALDKWRRGREQASSFLSHADAILLDEAHHTPAKSFKAVLYACKNASVRGGFTATYKRSGGDDMLLRAVTGGIIYKKTTTWMIRKGYLAKPIIALLPYDIPPKMEYDSYREAYSDGIVNNEGRNTLIADALAILHKHNTSTVVFVREKKHGIAIQRLLKNRCNLNGTGVVFATGDEDAATREEIIADFRAGKVRVLLCTQIFNEGIDFPEANCGVKASALKFEGTAIQQLGRILRKVPDPTTGEIDLQKPEKVFFIDIMDVHDEFLAEHALNRMTTYEKEDGYIVEYCETLQHLEHTVTKHIGEVHTIK